MKNIAWILSVVSVVVVCACANRDESNYQPVKKARVLATAVLEEVIAFDVKANEVNVTSEIKVEFLKINVEPKRELTGRVRTLKNFSSDRAQGPQCEVKTWTKSTSASQVEPVSAGKLQFSPANESTLVEIPEDASTHLYSRTILGLIPDGFYQLMGEGTDLIPGFEALLSMPGRIEDARVNGTIMTDKMAAIKKAEGVSLEWRAPSFSAERNILVVNIVGETETEKVQLECVALETDFIGAEATAKWTLPKVYVQQLPTTPAAKFYFARAHLELPKKLENLEANLQGIRTQAIRLLIGE